MKHRTIKIALILLLTSCLTACENVAVYGGISVSSGYSSYGSSSMRGNISIGGRLR